VLSPPLELLDTAINNNATVAGLTWPSTIISVTTSSDVASDATVIHVISESSCACMTIYGVKILRILLSDRI
jgi:hypothetical protein